MNSGLNPHQLRFVEAIEAGKGIGEAYLYAGYKAKKGNQYTMGSRLIRNVKVVAELDNRMFGRRKAAHQRFASMVDGATNVYIRILKMDAGTNEKLLALQAKISSDVFDRIGLKPKDEHQVDGTIDHTVSMVDLIKRATERRNNGDSG